MPKSIAIEQGHATPPPEPEEAKTPYVMPEVEQGIPLPTTRRGNRKYPWAGMKVGDSFWVRATPRAIYKAAFNYTKEKRLDWKFQAHDAVKDGIDGARCWRIK